VEPDFALNEDQAAAIRRVEEVLQAGEFRALVVYGVSGSGKTEVYVHAMRQALAAGKQAIMLVPEIALTTQLMRRLAARFDRVAVIHSGLSDTERSLAWDAIRVGRTPVVIGTRSAVFAPCPDLGIIVVDEEQEPSYKNLQSPRFHVRDVAIKRAHQLGIPILLGSATPSLETWHNQQILPAYERVELPHRVRSLPMPEVRLVDTRDQPVFGGGSISYPLMKELEGTLERGEQAVVLLNRRGYATWLYCPGCKQRVRCPNCHASMVLHRDREKMLCHHCQGTTDVPSFCADLSCRTRLVQGGGGTERIEQQLREYFPRARVRRADSDTMTHVRDYHALVRGFENGEIDILVGTQMIAKGLDFPNVSLVGVVGADAGGAATDFRAAERLFQLVTQVAGRAGRADVPGRVIVQSSATDTPALRFAMKHDFVGLAQAELPMRRLRGFPPYSCLTRFVLAGKRDHQTGEEAKALAERLRQTIAATGGGGDVLGPQLCVIERIRNMYRHEVLLRAPSAGRMLAILDAARGSGALRTRATSMIIDVDPVSMG
jgi:primosomal protein N' (replication factor Y)